MRFQARRRIPEELGFVCSHQGGCCIYTYAVQSISRKLEFALLYAYAPLGFMVQLPPRSFPLVLLPH